jgi:hypothetical protein
MSIIQKINMNVNDLKNMDSVLTKYLDITDDKKYIYLWQ